MLITDESNSSSNTNEWINQDIQWFQARSNHRRKNPTNTSKTMPTPGAFIFYLPSRNPTYPTNSNSNFLFRFVKSTSLANNSKFCLKNKFPTGSQLFVSYNYLHNIPTWIILSPRSSIITHRNVNFYWILTIRVQLTLQQQLSFQRSIFYYNYLSQSSSVLLSLELKYLTRSFVISWALKVSAVSRRFGTVKV